MKLCQERYFCNGQKRISHLITSQTNTKASTYDVQDVLSSKVRDIYRLSACWARLLEFKSSLLSNFIRLSWMDL